MAKIVNLKAMRKSRSRDEKARQGDANAARFGRSKAEKAREAALADKAARDLDGHRKE